MIELDDKDNIKKAYSYFKNKINTKKINNTTILNRILFVGIDLDGNEDEQQIFDTINSLGVRLTTADLLKNYTGHLIVTWCLTGRCLSDQCSPWPHRFASW